MHVCTLAELLPNAVGTANDEDNSPLPTGKKLAEHLGELCRTVLPPAFVKQENVVVVTETAEQAVALLANGCCLLTAHRAAGAFFQPGTNVVPLHAVHVLGAERNQWRSPRSFGTQDHHLLCHAC